MEKTNQKRMKNLLVRIGDEGLDYYQKNLEKLINITPQFMKQEESKQYFLERFRECVQKIPYKAFIYAVFYSVQLNNYPEFENLIDNIFLDLQNNLNEQNLLEVDNILLFLGELVKLNILNSFTYISILMDLVSGCENFEKQFFFFFYLTLNSIAHVQKTLQEKFEMEFKNLIDDLERIVQSKIKQDPSIKENWLLSYFQALKDNITLKENLFELSNPVCLSLIKNQKTLRKTFKLNITPNNNQNQCYLFLERKSSGLFEKNIQENFGKNSSLNMHMIEIYIWKNFLSYQKNFNLLLDKLFFRDFGKFNAAKNFLIIKHLFLIQEQKQNNNNKFISSMLMAKLINCFDFYLFFEECWKKYQNYFLENFQKFTLKTIFCIVENTINLNYLTNKNFSLFNEEAENEENKDELITKLIQDFIYLKQVKYNMNKEDAYQNHKSQLKTVEENQKDEKMEFIYIYQFLKSNSDQSNFFNFVDKVLGLQKEETKLRELFFQVFVITCSQNFIQFKSYLENYQEVFNDFFINNEDQFLKIFIDLNKSNYFVLQKSLVYLYLQKQFDKQKILNFILKSIFNEDFKFDLALLKTLLEIDQIETLKNESIKKQITESLELKVKEIKENKFSNVWSKYVELFN